MVRDTTPRSTPHERFCFRFEKVFAAQLIEPMGSQLAQAPQPCQQSRTFWGSTRGLRISVVRSEPLRMRLYGIPGLWLIWLIVLAGLLSTSAIPLQAQVVERVLVAAPREYQRFLETAKAAIEREEYSVAIANLSALLDPTDPAAEKRFGEAEIHEDYFVGRSNDTRFKSSLRTEARRLLGSLPPRGKELYRLNYGAKAQRMLDEALSARDASLLSEVSWRYFHTEAGYAASMLLGQHLLDMGRPLSAAKTFERLVETDEALSLHDPELSVLLAMSWHQCGRDQRAADALSALQRRRPGVAIQLAGRRVVLDDTIQSAQSATDWLSQVIQVPEAIQKLQFAEWRTHRGGPNRNPVGDADVPLSRHRWFVPVASDPEDERLLRGLRLDFRDGPEAPVPAISPLVVQDVVLFRTVEGMLAVDFETGKRIWEFPWAEPVASFLSDQDADARGSDRRQQLEERLLHDQIHGQMSSDGQHLFLIDDLEFTADTTHSRRRLTNQSPTNSLVALDIGTQGKYRWRVGGKSGGDERDLADAFFLGPPLVLDKDLYVLAEIRGDLSLFVLDPGTGALQWSQQIAHVGFQRRLYDPLRRLAGATPAYSDGVLICPTSAGAVVAIDISTRSLLWGYQYPTEMSHANRFRIRRNFGAHRGIRGLDETWAESVVAVDSGKVLLTPLESDQLQCLDLLTGEPLWRYDREQQQLQYVACIAADQAIVVGRSSVIALDLEEGNETWRLPLGDSSMSATEYPTGRGLLTGSRYLLPTSQRLIEIDTMDGTITREAPVASLGNLVDYRGQLISMTLDGVAAFHQRGDLQATIARRLEADPEDAWAWEHRGQLALDDGNVNQALAMLRRAYENYDPNDPNRESARNLLVETLINVLDSDLDANVELLAECADLVEGPQQRDALLRLRGRWLLDSNRPREAFEVFLQLAQHASRDALTYGGLLAGTDGLLDVPNQALRVRRERAVRAGLTRAMQEASPAEREQMDSQIHQSLEELRAAGQASPIDWVSFIAHFSDHSIADAARLQLAKLYIDGGDYLRAEYYLGPLVAERHQSAAKAGRKLEAWYLLSQAMASGGDYAAAANCLQRFKEIAGGEPFSIEPGGKKQTANQWANQVVSAHGEKLSQVVEAAEWPYGQVRSTPANPRRRRSILNDTRPAALRHAAAALPYEIQVGYGYRNRGSVTISDQWGRERLRVPGASQRTRVGSRDVISGVTLGHLALVNYGFTVAGIDGLNRTGSEGDQDQNLLWPANFVEQFDSLTPASSGTGSLPQDVEPNAWGQTVVRRRGDRVDQLGPVTYDGVMILQDNVLRCLDPLTGQPNWIRHDIDPGSRVFGDDQYVLVHAPDQSSARLLDAVNGDELGTRGLPKNLWVTAGHYVLTWQDTEKQRTVRLIDPVAEKTLWSRSFEPEAKGFAHAARGLLAVIEPSGRLAVLDLNTGRTRVEQSLPNTRRTLESVQLVANDDQWIVIRGFSPKAVRGKQIEPYPPLDTQPLVDGEVYALDPHTGQAQWASPAIIESYALPSNQPKGVPALVFARKVQEDGNGRSTAEMVWIDRRDGRLLSKWEGMRVVTYSTLNITAAPEEHSVAVRTISSRERQLTFTDAPHPPAPPAQTGTATRAPKSGAFNVLKSLIPFQRDDDD